MKRIENAYAKINLFLDVTGRLQNGFHEISSIMHSVGLKDTVSLEIFPHSVENRISMYIKGNYYLPCNEKNLAYRAAEAFMQAIGERFSLKIGINKNIPVSAGLAGGSSDAAAVLKGLNRMKGNPLSLERLCQVGETLGSDVPFCIMGKTQHCTGRGEKLSKIPFEKRLNLVIAIGGEHISTPMAYSKLDELYKDFESPRDNRERLDALVLGIKEKDEKKIADNMYNIFEEAILPLCPEAREIKEKMLSLGAIGAMMSGSGPSVFGIFDSYEKAESVARALGDRAYAVTSV
ncbi:MAG: 4-(cytidine 5'-diphospho)-2-C-methyl-D-erythritol kinase [Clostridia bacterium]|nr:4-(cytidine 5'-diphospho)-2-C-methyl-D-erythritol kinase [Clostridia bacterium]